MTDKVKLAIRALPELAWTAAVDANGSLREGAHVAELTGLPPHLTAAGWPPGMRVIVRRERPHPARSSPSPTMTAGRSRPSPPTPVAVSSRTWKPGTARTARVEDRIRCAKVTGLNDPPSREYKINQVWLELTLMACDLIAWTQTTLLDGDLAKAEPRLLRYKLLHAAARVTRGQRCVFVRIDAGWPWRHVLAAAFARLQALGLHPGRWTRVTLPVRQCVVRCSQIRVGSACLGLSAGGVGCIALRSR